VCDMSFREAQHAEAFLAGGAWTFHWTGDNRILQTV
jgi:hypothetical protein